jgi:hypothetical protein
LGWVLVKRRWNGFIPDSLENCHCAYIVRTMNGFQAWLNSTKLIQQSACLHPSAT